MYFNELASHIELTKEEKNKYARQGEDRALAAKAISQARKTVGDIFLHPRQEDGSILLCCYDFNSVYNSRRENRQMQALVEKYNPFMLSSPVLASAEYGYIQFLFPKIYAHISDNGSFLIGEATVVEGGIYSLSPDLLVIIEQVITSAENPLKWSDVDTLKASLKLPKQKLSVW